MESVIGVGRHRLQACPPVHLDIFRLLLLNQGNSWIAQDPVVQVPCLAQGHRILVEDSGARCESVALSSEASPPFVSLRSIDEQPGTLNRLHDRLHPGLSKQERPAADKASNQQRCRRGRTRAERVSEAVESVFLRLLGDLHRSRRAIERRDHARKGVGSNGGRAQRGYPANLAREGDPIGLTAEAGAGGLPTLRAWARLAESARPNHGLTTEVTGHGLRYPVEISENSRFSGFSRGE